MDNGGATKVKLFKFYFQDYHKKGLRLEAFNYAN